MIVLEQTGTTSVVLELFTHASGQTPIYLFEVTRKGASESKTFIAEDVSSACCRCNIFEIVNSNTEDLENGVVYLIPGEYDYTVYELTIQDLNATRIRTLQTGCMYVKGTIDSVYF